MNQRLKHNPGFRRLKQGGLGFTGRTSYWLGRDHLLIVEVANYTERYRRLFFSDIQAVTVQATQMRMWWNFGLAILTVLSLFGIALTWFNVEPTDGWAAMLIFVIGCGILALLGVIGLVLNALRGPTGAAYVRTAVQTQKLRGLTRWRKAEELMLELAPLIQSAQATPASSADHFEIPLDQDSGLGSIANGPALP